MNIVTDIDMVENLIHMETEDWRGDCHAIANALIEQGVVFVHPSMGEHIYLRYGHYIGPIDPNSQFAGRSVMRHGWIEVRYSDRELIIDPTRWVFEEVPPYIYVGSNDYYDMGGSKLRNELRSDKEIPACDGSSVIEFANDGLGDYLMDFFSCPDSCRGLSREQLFWIGNEDPRELGKIAKPLYEWLIAGGQAAIIPIDYREFVFGRKDA